ncbi:YqhG family protein [Metabacillus litoralis]|uniref:YqhG family protein n=1 Tax=Metabacillus litoralis TaxID=152268 RepID=UPI00203AC414|nr:YqhG family protein [Metabacillus litoralis]MCM3161717.1 YqhG family protein [Metabacillus litoralis]
MQQEQIHSYLESFFTANSCDIIEKGQGYMTVQLTIEMDKELMNRPFYWHYLEKTNGVPNPMKLTLITDQNRAPSDLKGEVMHFGAPRLHQIFRSTTNLGSYIRLFEQVKEPGGNIPLHPWIGVNIIVSYQCDMKKDQLYSIGLHLVSGTLVENFQEKLEKLALTPKIPDLCFTMTPLIKPQSGLKRIEQFIMQSIHEQDHSWADKARERWNEDLKLLDHFYEDMDEKPDCYEVEKEALRELYEPQINISVQNGGVFYLTPHGIFK